MRLMSERITIPPHSPSLGPPAWERIHRMFKGGSEQWEEAREIGDYYYLQFLVVFPGSYEM